MIGLLEAKKDEVAALCRKYGVRRLDAFGSVTTDAFDPATSDLDFVAEFADRSPGYANRYLFFAEALEALFDRSVDLLTEDMIKSPIFREDEVIWDIVVSNLPVLTLQITTLLDEAGA